MGAGGPTVTKARSENTHSVEPPGIGRATSREKPIRKPWREARKSPSRLPRSTQTRIVVTSAAGRSQRDTSRELGLSRNTVARVLSQAEYQELLGLFRDQLLELVPESLCVARHRLRQNSEKMAIEVLRGTQVAVPRQEAEVIERDEFSGKTTAELLWYADHGAWPGEPRGDGGAAVTVEPVPSPQAGNGDRGRGEM